MADSNFIDYVKIFCRSGNGGAGSTHMSLKADESVLPFLRKRLSE